MFFVQGLAIMDFLEAVLMTSFLGQRLAFYNEKFLLLSSSS